MLFEDFQGIEPKAKINPQNENIAHICWVKCLGFFFFASVPWTLPSVPDGTER